MKQVISLCLISAICIGSGVPLFAQKGRQVSTTKVTRGAANKFTEVRAFSDDNGVLIKWKMAAETNGLGFFVYRTDENGTRVVSNSAVLGSAARYGAMRTGGDEYSYFDENGDRSGSYFVRSVAMDGTSIVSDVVPPSYVASLTAVGSAASARFTSAGFRKEAERQTRRE